jgi:Ca-activated chloride channel family protein
MTKRSRRVLCCALVLALAPACVHEPAPHAQRARQTSHAASVKETPKDDGYVRARLAPSAAASAEAPLVAEPTPASDAWLKGATSPYAADEALGYAPQGALGDMNANAPLGLQGIGTGGGGTGSGYGRAEGGMRARAAKPKRAMAAPAESKILGTLHQATGAYVAPAAPPAADLNREAYAHVAENDFQHVRDQPLSTFSIDVDTASYSNVRRYLREGALPPPDAVRIEELVNYFDYAYPRPENGQPFATYAEVGACPWNKAHQLVHIGIAGQRIEDGAVPARNLVFLIDVSGSMEDANKLPLLKQGLSLLARNLRPQDRISMVVYAGSSGLVLPATSGANQPRVLEALDRLQAGGSTNGGEGIQLAYHEAQKNFIQGGINRVILATDGDFNVGVTSEGALTRLIEDKRKSGVFLTVLGFGSGNLQDSRMEQLADKGNGNYAYIDDLEEAHKVLVREAGATLVTIAKDVKLQVEFNPERVQSYRLVGYENRALAARDFNDDKKDAGEIGAGHTVTALYEIVPRIPGQAAASEVDPLRYQTHHAPKENPSRSELLSVKIRYKAPHADVSQLIERQLAVGNASQSHGSDVFRFAAAVAEFGMLLRHSTHRGSATLEQVRKLAESARAHDPDGERAQFLDMVQASARLGLGG